MQPVVGTGLRIFLVILNKRKRASPGFVATATMKAGFLEDWENNQRFRIYKQVMQNFFGLDTFTHYVDAVNSAYIMVNNLNTNSSFLRQMEHRFKGLYPGMLNLEFSAI